MLDWKIEDNLMEITARGKLTSEDYKRVLPVIDNLIESPGNPKFLFILEQFEGLGGRCCLAGY